MRLEREKRADGDVEAHRERAVEGVNEDDVLREGDRDGRRGEAGQHGGSREEVRRVERPGGSPCRVVEMVRKVWVRRRAGESGADGAD